MESFSHPQHNSMDASKNLPSLHFPLLYFLVFSFFSLARAALNPTEYAAFMDIYNTMGGPSWYNFYNTSADPCTYVMVTCDMSSTTITKLRLRSNNLVGPISSSIGSFPNAIQVTLAGNSLSGSIPDTISGLTAVEILDFSDAGLSGPVPEGIGSLLTLNKLYLYHNQFTSLPDSIANLLKLTVLQANDNNLTGSIPSLQKLTFLQALFLENNNLTGTIPDFPTNSMMQVFSVSLNNISGTIPASIGNAQDMFSFFANNNSLNGTLPAALTMLPNLWMLYAADNFLLGTLPEFTPALRYNQFYGSLPSSLFQLPNTTIIDVRVNHFNGTVPPQIVNYPHYNFSCNAIQSPLCPDCGPCELCGDGFCDLLGLENCATCPQDCGAAPCGICGDGVCQSEVGESCSSCYIDCGLCAPPPTKKCPGNPQCSGRGTCSPTTLICSCNAGFTGPACESTVQNVTVGSNPSNPITTITSSSGTAFEVNIKTLTEYNPAGEVVSQVNFTTLPLTLTESEMIDSDNVLLHNWTYSGPLPGPAGSDASITVTIVFYYNATTVQFANQTYNLTAQTTKYTLAVRNWPFASLRNTFGITFAAQDSRKSAVCVQSQKDSEGNVQWIKLILPNEFTEIVELDTKIIHGSFDNPDPAAVELRVPHFWDELVFDPNFSLLVTDLKSTASECFQKSKLPNWAIILISILGTGAVIVIILGSLYGFKRIKQMRQVKEARAAHNIEAGPSSGVGMMRV